MNSEKATRLPYINSQSVLEIKGEDAVKFLQGQCSADIEKLETHRATPGCICTVKGRVITSFVCLKTDESLLLRMPNDLVQPCIDYLSKYAAFFKVELKAWQAPCVLSYLPGTTNKIESSSVLSATYQLGDTRFHELLISEEAANELAGLEESLMPENHWQQAQIEAGWLNLNSHTSEKYLPHQMNLDQLGAISFTKGCYTGQEIIARTEYRGKPKRRVHLLELDNPQIADNELPIELVNPESGKTEGELIRLLNGKALALISIETDENGTFLVQGQEANYKINKELFAN